jgi:transcriptional regulator of acetoin/glycerol metabolism
VGGGLHITSVVVTNNDPNREVYVRLDEVRRRHVISVLDACGGKRGAAARILGIDRKTLYRRMRRWHIKL